jgi:hypothetical protein
MPVAAAAKIVENLFWSMEEEAGEKTTCAEQWFAWSARAYLEDDHGMGWHCPILRSKREGKGDDDTASNT